MTERKKIKNRIFFPLIFSFVFFPFSLFPSSCFLCGFFFLPSPFLSLPFLLPPFFHHFFFFPFSFLSVAGAHVSPSRGRDRSVLIFYCLSVIWYSWCKSTAIPHSKPVHFIHVWIFKCSQCMMGFVQHRWWPLMVCFSRKRCFPKFSGMITMFCCSVTLCSRGCCISSSVRAEPHKEALAAQWAHAGIAHETV